MYSREKIRKFEDDFGKWFSKVFCRVASLFINKDRLLVKGFYAKAREAAEKNGFDYIQVYPRIHGDLRPPTTQDPIHELFKATYANFPEEFIMQVPESRVFDREGLVILPDNMGVLDVNIMGESYKSIKKILAEDVSYVEGNSLCLCTNWSNFYYHWIIDVLPKLHIFEQTGLQTDNFIVNGMTHDYQRKAIELMGIPSEKIIETKPGLNIKCQNLIITSQPGYMGVCPEWAANYIRSRLAQDIPASEPVNIYISRSRASQRKVLNEDELFKYLSSKGFEQVFCEDYSLEEQIKLFKSAKTIVAPHGSGLTNIVFSYPGTKIVEIFSPTYMEPCYWRLASALNLDYHYVLGRENIENHNIVLDIDKLKDIL